MDYNSSEKTINKLRTERVTSGVSGLDTILMGGFVDKRGYLVRGGPGTGKTTLGMHFLAEGVRANQKSLYITLGESAADLKANANNVGIVTDGITFLDLSPESDFFAAIKSYDLFSSAEVERDPITKRIVDCIQREKPRRVFLDSTSHLRYLAIDAFQFRKQLLSFIRFLLEQDSVVLYTSEGSHAMPDDDVMYISDGVVNLSLSGKARFVEVTKFRGSDFYTGPHTLRLTATGAKVFPRLIPAEHGRPFDPSPISSGVLEIDKLLHGGIERGTVSIFTGPAGVGKTTLALQFARAAAEKGNHTAYFSFEESVDSLVHRAHAVRIPLRGMIDAGALKIFAVEPLSFTADEIGAMVRHEVEINDVKTVVFDGVTGFRLSVIGDLQTQLRSLFKYLSNMGVTTVAINETESITGDFKATELGISYLADNILFIRYLELQGEMRKAIGVLKKRLGDFERHLREFAITNKGIVVGKPLMNLRGILNGVPEWTQGIETDERIKS